MTLFAKFSNPLVLNAPAEVFPLEICNGDGTKITALMPIAESQKV